MRQRSLVPWLLAFGFLALACGGNQRQTTLRASFVTVGAVLSGFETWESEHQDKIIAEAPTKEAGREQLDLFRIKRDHVYKLFPVVYQAIALAAVSDDEKTLAAAADAAKKLIDAVTALKEKP